MVTIIDNDIFLWLVSHLYLQIKGLSNIDSHY